MTCNIILTILSQDSLRQKKPDVQQFPKLMSLLKQLMGGQENSATSNPDDPQGEVLLQLGVTYTQ